MYMRSGIFRIVYLGIVSVAILLSAAFRQSTVQAAPVAGGRWAGHSGLIRGRRAASPTSIR